MKKSLGKTAQAQLRQLLLSGEGREIVACLMANSPTAEISPSSTVEGIALKGAQAIGWGRCIQKLEGLANIKHEEQ